MATLSMDLRQRILIAYDRGGVTRLQVAQRFEVSLGMVKKLLQLRKTGNIAPRHHRSGRKPIILDSHRREMRALLAKEPDLTLEEIRVRVGLECTIQAIHYVLVDMGFTYKKKRFARRSSRVLTSRALAEPGEKSSQVSTRRASFSSTNPPPKPI